MYKRKIIIAVAILLVCVIMLSAASYAWFTMSRMPEVSGISTNVGANGSLEIALLDRLTYLDPTSIRVGIGDSAAVKDLFEANKTWGNLVDLSDENYGLNKITLFPSRLNLHPGADGTFRPAVFVGQRGVCPLNEISTHDGNNPVVSKFS